MDTPLLLTLVLAFAAVFATLEGVWMLWQGSRGAQARRLRERVRRVAARDQQARRVALLKQNSPSHGSPGGQSLQRLLLQAGLEWPASKLLAWTAACAAGAVLLALVLQLPLRIVVFATGAAGCAPLLIVLGRRHARLARLQAQLPDAVDLMARAMRAGHALPVALQMVGEEASEPLAGEFRIAHEEVNLGLGLDDALRNLAARVPSDDLRFLVIAVLLQRETGGNLAEVLSRIAALVRSRHRLLGKVRVLAAEGKFSAWILALLPLVVGAALNLLNPAFMRPLWTDPLGVTMLQACAALYAVGVLWMRRVVRIRV